MNVMQGLQQLLKVQNDNDNNNGFIQHFHKVVLFRLKCNYSFNGLYRPFPDVWSAFGPVLAVGVLPLLRTHLIQVVGSFFHPHIPVSKSQSGEKKYKSIQATTGMQ